MFPSQKMYEDLVGAAAATGSHTVSLAGYVCRLFQTDIPADPAVPVAVYNSDSATFTGYAEQAVTWSAPTIGTDGLMEAVGTVPEFRPTDAVTPNSIYGAYLVDGDDSLAAVGRFDDAPVAMGSPLNKIELTVRFIPAVSFPIVIVP